MLTSVKPGTTSKSSLLHCAALEQLASIRLHRKHPALLLGVIKSCLIQSAAQVVCPTHLEVTVLQIHAKLGSVLLRFAPPDITLLRQHQTARAEGLPVSPRQAGLLQQAGAHGAERRRRRFSCRQGRSSFTADLARAAAAACCTNAIPMGNTGRQHGGRRQTALSCRTLRP